MTDSPAPADLAAVTAALVAIAHAAGRPTPDQPVSPPATTPAAPSPSGTEPNKETTPVSHQPDPGQPGVGQPGVGQPDRGQSGPGQPSGGQSGGGQSGGGQSGSGRAVVTGPELLDALALLRWAQAELSKLEPILIAAARGAGVSWQALAPALGVASRQAAERRYLRGTAAPTDRPDDTRDDRVQAERDRRAGNRAVARWANHNTADLRRLAGQITALTDLGDTATADLTQLHRALGDPDAAALPGLLAATHRHLPAHPDLAAQIDTITTHTDHIRRHPERRTSDSSPDPSPSPASGPSSGPSGLDSDSDSGRDPNRDSDSGHASGLNSGHASDSNRDPGPQLKP